MLKCLEWGIWSSIKVLGYIFMKMEQGDQNFMIFSQWIKMTFSTSKVEGRHITSWTYRSGSNCVWRGTEYACSNSFIRDQICVQYTCNVTNDMPAMTLCHERNLESNYLFLTPKATVNYMLVCFLNQIKDV